MVGINGLSLSRNITEKASLVIDGIVSGNVSTKQFWMKQIKDYMVLIYFSLQIIPHMGSRVIYYEELGIMVDSERAQVSQGNGEVEMVKDAVRGDQLAFAGLYAKYADPIGFHITKIVGNVDVGKDLTQETFFKAWNSF